MIKIRELDSDSDESSDGTDSQGGGEYLEQQEEDEEVQEDHGRVRERSVDSDLSEHDSGDSEGSDGSETAGRDQATFFSLPNSAMAPFLAAQTGFPEVPALAPSLLQPVASSGKVSLFARARQMTTVRPRTSTAPLGVPLTGVTRISGPSAQRPASSGLAAVSWASDDPADRLLAEVHQENLQRLGQMDQAELQAAQEEISAQLSPKMLEMLRLRGLRRLQREEPTVDSAAAASPFQEASRHLTQDLSGIEDGVIEHDSDGDDGHDSEGGGQQEAQSADADEEAAEAFRSLVDNYRRLLFFRSSGEPSVPPAMDPHKPAGPEMFPLDGSAKEAEAEAFDGLQRQLAQLSKARFGQTAVPINSRHRSSVAASQPQGGISDLEEFVLQQAMAEQGLSPATTREYHEAVTRWMRSDGRHPASSGRSKRRRKSVLVDIGADEDDGSSPLESETECVESFPAEQPSEDPDDAVWNSFRLDFSGNPASESVPSHLGLHHHGLQPSRAGYSLPELLLMLRSSVPAQRSAGLLVLGRVIRRLRSVGSTPAPHGPQGTLSLATQLSPRLFPKLGGKRPSDPAMARAAIRYLLQRGSVIPRLRLCLDEGAVSVVLPALAALLALIEPPEWPGAAEKEEGIDAIGGGASNALWLRMAPSPLDLAAKTRPSQGPFAPASRAASPLSSDPSLGGNREEQEQESLERHDRLAGADVVAALLKMQTPARLRYLLEVVGPALVGSPDDSGSPSASLPSGGDDGGQGSIADEQGDSSEEVGTPGWAQEWLPRLPLNLACVRMLLALCQHSPNACDAVAQAPRLVEVLGQLLRSVVETLTQRALPRTLPRAPPGAFRGLVELCAGLWRLLRLVFEASADAQALLGRLAAAGADLPETVRLVVFAANGRVLLPELAPDLPSSVGESSSGGAGSDRRNALLVVSGLALLLWRSWLIRDGLQGGLFLSLYQVLVPLLQEVASAVPSSASREESSATSFMLAADSSSQLRRIQASILVSVLRQLCQLVRTRRSCGVCWADLSGTVETCVGVLPNLWGLQGGSYPGISASALHLQAALVRLGLEYLQMPGRSENPIHAEAVLRLLRSALSAEADLEVVLEDPGKPGGDRPVVPVVHDALPYPSQFPEANWDASETASLASSRCLLLAAVLECAPRAAAVVHGPSAVRQLVDTKGDGGCAQGLLKWILGLRGILERPRRRMGLLRRSQLELAAQGCLLGQWMLDSKDAFASDSQQQQIRSELRSSVVALAHGVFVGCVAVGLRDHALRLLQECLIVVKSRGGMTSAEVAPLLRTAVGAAFGLLGLPASGGQTVLAPLVEEIFADPALSLPGLQPCLHAGSPSRVASAVLEEIRKQQSGTESRAHDTDDENELEQGAEGKAEEFEDIAEELPDEAHFLEKPHEIQHTLRMPADLASRLWPFGLVRRDLLPQLATLVSQDPQLCGPKKPVAATSAAAMETLVRGLLEWIDGLVQQGVLKGQDRPIIWRFLAELWRTDAASFLGEGAQPLLAGLLDWVYGGPRPFRLLKQRATAGFLWGPDGFGFIQSLVQYSAATSLGNPMVARLLLPVLRTSDASLGVDIWLLVWKEFRSIYSSLEAPLPWNRLGLYLALPQPALAALQADALANGGLNPSHTPQLFRLAAVQYLVFLIGSPSVVACRRRLKQLVFSFTQCHSPLAGTRLKELFGVWRDLLEKNPAGDTENLEVLLGFPQDRLVEAVEHLLGTDELGPAGVGLLQMAWKESQSQV